MTIPILCQCSNYEKIPDLSWNFIHQNTQQTNIGNHLTEILIKDYISWSVFFHRHFSRSNRNPTGVLLKEFNWDLTTESISSISLFEQFRNGPILCHILSWLLRLNPLCQRSIKEHSLKSLKEGRHKSHRRRHRLNHSTANCSPKMKIIWVEP